jgi:two-component system, NarL family, sensor histidine kinase UhpB
MPPVAELSVQAPSSAAAALPAVAAGEPLPAVRTSLQLRLSLLITALLAIVTLAGGLYVVRSARDDIRAEVRSTLNLTSHLLDAQIALLRDGAPQAAGLPLFGLRELRDVRHLSVQFYNNEGRLLESNISGTGHAPLAPRWFARLIRSATPDLAAQTRIVSVNGASVGRLVISPDPTSETDEMWATSSGLLGLLLLFFVLVNALVWWAVARAMRPVAHILQALGELRRGNLAARLPQFAEPEMARISTGFNHMAATLESSLSENQRLTRRLLKTQEDERTRLARELHDEIGQCVSAIHADAVAIRNQGDARVREGAEAIVAVAGELKQIVRGMLHRLRPPLLTEVGLADALQELVAGFQQRNPGLDCALRCSGQLSLLDDAMATALYRVVQECLSNITLHASARHAVIEVLLQEAAAGSAVSAVSVTASDDGVGFLQGAARTGFGLTGIRERVSALGGSCRIDSRPGGGTRVAVQIPLNAQGAAA